MQRIIVFTIAIGLIFMGCRHEKQTEFKFDFQEGDLLFQDLDCGPLCDAIEKVTEGTNGANFSHIGMIIKNKQEKLIVIEAISPNVKFTEINEFLLRNTDTTGNPKVMVGRIKDEHNFLIPRATSYVLTLLNKPYDNIYMIDNNSFYCSELIYEAFKMSNMGIQFFKLAPMTFNDPKTRKPFPAWVDYYKELNHPIPEDYPGLNPGSISRSDKIDIIHWFYEPQVNKE